MNIENRLKRIIAERDIQKRKGRIAGKITILLSVLLIGIFIGSFFLQNNFSITGFASGALPTVGGDSGNWGTILNNYLSQEHNADGSHGNVTAESLNVSGLIRANNWSNVSITESQISGLHVWNATNTSYRTLDNLTFNGNTNISGNLNVTGNVNVTGNLSVESHLNTSTFGGSLKIYTGESSGTTYTISPYTVVKLHGGTALKTGNSLSTSGAVTGQIVYLYGNSWGVQINDDSNVDLADDVAITLGNVAGQYRGLIVVFDGTQWVEISRGGVNV